MLRVIPYNIWVFHTNLSSVPLIDDTSFVIFFCDDRVSLYVFVLLQYQGQKIFITKPSQLLCSMSGIQIHVTLSPYMFLGLLYVM